MSATGFTVTTQNGTPIKCILRGAHDWEVTVEELVDGSTRLSAVAVPQSESDPANSRFEEDLAAGYSQPDTEEFHQSVSRYSPLQDDGTADTVAPTTDNGVARQVELQDLRDRMDKIYRAVETAHFKMKNFIRRELYIRDDAIGHSQTQDWASDSETAGNTRSPLGSPIKEPAKKRAREN